MCVCVYDFVWCVSASIFLGRWFTVSSSLRGLSSVEELLMKMRVQLRKYKIKLKTTEPVNLPSFAIRETEARKRNFPKVTDDLRGSTSHQDHSHLPLIPLLT